MLEWWQWGLVCTAASLVGVSKTGITGLGILSVAIFASVLPARESVGAVLVSLIAGDLVAVSTYRHDADWPSLLRLFPWTAVGVVVGAFTLGRIDDANMRHLIGGILVILLVMHIIQRFTQPPTADSIPLPLRNPWVARLTGVVAGFTTMAANASGPVMVLYLLALRLPKIVFLGTTAWFFLVLNLFKVPFSIGLGMITPGSLTISLRLIPFTIIGALTGRWLIKYIDQKRFEQIALALSLIAGIRLLF
jgi:uncharacterized membrane protein YfcA